MEIKRDTTIENLISHYPAAVSCFGKHRINVFVRGVAVFGTVESIARKKGFSEEEIDEMIKELNEKYRHRGKI